MKRRGRHALRRRYGAARVHATNVQVADRMFSAADALFTCRGALRPDQEMLQDVYDDATGIASDLYADPLVKETKDKMYRLDHEIGDVARQMEHLARTIRKKGSAA